VSKSLGAVVYETKEKSSLKLQRKESQSSDLHTLTCAISVKKDNEDLNLVF